MKHGMVAQNVQEIIERKKIVTYLMTLIQANRKDEALEYIFTPDFQSRLTDMLNVVEQVHQMQDDFQALSTVNQKMKEQLSQYQSELEELKQSFLSKGEEVTMAE